MRTDEEKHAFTSMCLAIEKAGGDVLGFIEKQWPSYSPGGCWHNLQRTYTKRQNARLTYGRKDEEKMAKTRQSQEKTVQLLLEAEKNHQDAWAVLTACGYTNPHCALRNAKNWCIANHPEWLEPLRNIHLVDPNPKPRGKAADDAETALQDSPKDDSPKPVETPEAAKERQTDVLPADRPVCTCCVPGRESGVTVPDELPAEKPKARMKVIEVETDLGSFRKEEDKIAFRRADDGKDYRNQLKMTVPQWKQLVQEMDDVLEMLEAIEY